MAPGYIDWTGEYGMVVAPGHDRDAEEDDACSPILWSYGTTWAWLWLCACVHMLFLAVFFLFFFGGRTGSCCAHRWAGFNLIPG